MLNKKDADSTKHVFEQREVLLSNFAHSVRAENVKYQIMQ